MISSMILYREVKNRKLLCRNRLRDFKMSGLSTCFVSVMCLLVFLTGQSSGLIWRPTQRPPPTYPADPTDSYYQAFQTVPPPRVTAEKFMTNFLGIGNSPGRKRRATTIEDTVVVIDGSGSIHYCEFQKGKKALKNLMGDMIKPGFDTKYAAVTFSNSAKVNFKFLPYSSAAKEIMNIPYPDGATNTQAGLAEAKKLFDNPSSGRRDFSKRTVLLFTDGRSNIETHLTIPIAKALKDSGVEIFVVAVGSYINGIDEMVKVASSPPDDYMYRVETLGEFHVITELILQKVYPQKWKIAAGEYDPPCMLSPIPLGK